MSSTDESAHLAAPQRIGGGHSRIGAGLTPAPAAGAIPGPVYAPPAVGGRRGDPKLSVEIDADLHARATALADEAGVSLNELAQVLLLNGPPTTASEAKSLILTELADHPASSLARLDVRTTREVLDPLAVMVNTVRDDLAARGIKRTKASRGVLVAAILRAGLPDTAEATRGLVAQHEQDQIRRELGRS